MPCLGRAGSRASLDPVPGVRLQWGVPTPSPDTQTSCRQHATHTTHCSNAQLSKHSSSCDSFVCKPASDESLFINPFANCHRSLMMPHVALMGPSHR